jgi:SAM-dependent methyltransferase
MRCRLCSADARPAGQSKGLRTGRKFSLAQCPACGFAWVLDPITDVASLYDDAYYAGRGSDPLVDFAFEYEHPEKTVRQSEWRGVLRIVRRLAPQARTWLDLGCGTGGLVRYVASQSRCEVAGFDQGAWAERARGEGLPILDAGDLETRAGSFDVVTAIEVIEHVIDPVDFLRQARRMLRPGGLIFLTTANVECAPAELASWYYMEPEVHVSLFSPRALGLALSAAGFAVEHAGLLPGFDDIIRFKVLKRLRARSRRVWHSVVPWGLLAHLVDRHYGISAMPSGRALP